MDDRSPAIMNPPHDIPMLEWWRGIYDQVFIAPHPFYGVQRPDGHGREQLLDWKMRPPDYDYAVKRRGDAVPWSDAHQRAAPDVPRAAVYLAIWLMGCNGYTERANIALQERLVTWAEAERLNFPQDDGMPPILEPVIGDFLTSLGASEVRAFDEFRDNCAVFPVRAFAADQPPLQMPKFTTSSAIWGLHLPDPGVLITWGFDGTEALIAMTSHARSISRPEDRFEGWYADQATYIDVFNPREFRTRRTSSVG